MLPSTIGTDREEEFDSRLFEDVVKELGYSVRTPGQLMGRSGVLHSFTMCAWIGKEKEIAIDLDDLARPPEISILALYAKAFDTDVERQILITSRSLGEAKLLAKLYNIFLIPSRISPDDLRRKLRDFLSSNTRFPSSFYGVV